MKSLALTLAFVTNPALADELIPLNTFPYQAGTNESDASYYLNLGGVSHHFRNDAIHNDLNYGLGIEYRVSDAFGITGGVYHNSLYRNSFYGLVRYQPVNLGPIRSGVVAGTVNGYNSHGFIPYVMPAISADVKAMTVSLIGVPSIGRVDGVISLQFSWRITP